MTAVEIVLLVIGVVFFVASFFITEKLSSGELNKIGELSKADIHKIMEREVQKVSGKIENQVEEKAEEILVRAERSMEKESNEKIMAISEYADTVMESMNKTHNEIMFLYSMLNDKHTELTQFSSKLQDVAGDLQRIEDENEQKVLQKTFAMENMPDELEEQNVLMEEREALYVEKQPEEQQKSWFATKEENNHNEAILALHKEGKTGMEIARKLGLGIGEVRLVISLYEGNRK